MPVPNTRNAHRVFRPIDTLLLLQLSDKPCPAGLVARAQARAVIAVKKFVEQEIVAPVGIALQSLIISIERAVSSLVSQEEPCQALR